MINADIRLATSSEFYNMIIEDKKVTGYEVFFEIINMFKNKFDFTIHSISQTDNRTLQISFNGDYIIELKESNHYYIELYSHVDSIEDFTEKFKYLKELMAK